MAACVKLRELGTWHAQQLDSRRQVTKNKGEPHAVTKTSEIQCKILSLCVRLLCVRHRSFTIVAQSPSMAPSADEAYVHASSEAVLGALYRSVQIMIDEDEVQDVL